MALVRVLPPVTSDPDVSVVSVFPISRHPHCSVTRRMRPITRHPVVSASIPVVITLHPNETRTWSGAITRDLRRWRSVSDHISWLRRTSTDYKNKYE